jgi:hypothetical protein
MIDACYQREKCREWCCEKSLVYSSGARYCQDTVLSPKCSGNRVEVDEIDVRFLFEVVPSTFLK